MKKIIILFGCLFLSFSWSQNKKTEKTIEVIYSKAYKNHKDTTNTPPKLMKDLEYQLLFDNNESRFEYISQMTIDGNKTNERFVGRIGGSGVYYKNLKEKNKFRFINKYDTNFIIEEEPNKIRWTLLKETKVILGYDCFKAVGQYEEYSNFMKKNKTFNIVVWYAPSIPVPFGPAGYDGLPGLVLEASRSSFYFIATNINLENKTKIKKSKKGKIIKQKDFNKLIYSNRAGANSLD